MKRTADIGGRRLREQLERDPTLVGSMTQPHRITPGGHGLRTNFRTLTVWCVDCKKKCSDKRAMQLRIEWRRSTGEGITDDDAFDMLWGPCPVPKDG